MNMSDNCMMDTAVCRICGETLKPKGITRHLTACRKRHPLELGKKEVTLLTLSVKDQYRPFYFLYLELDGAQRFFHLDDFLRKTWLECCGHLSAFRIGEVSYSSCPDPEFDMNDVGMAPKLQDVLSKGMKFGYEYDFGSTTSLSLAVVDLRVTREKAPSQPLVLVRNEPPVWVCTECGAPAKKVSCCGFGIEPTNVYCAACAKKRSKDEEDYFLNIANSPRTGVCAYESNR